MLQLPITACTAAFATLVLVVLSVMVIMRRTAARVTLGLGGDETLERRVRAQANYVEYVPMGLVVLGFAEASGAPGALIVAAAAALMSGRLIHAAGMLANRLPLRVVGMLLTFASLLTAAGVIVAAAV